MQAGKYLQNHSKSAARMAAASTSCDWEIFSWQAQENFPHSAFPGNSLAVQKTATSKNEAIRHYINIAFNDGIVSFIFREN